MAGIEMAGMAEMAEGARKSSFGAEKWARCHFAHCLHVLSPATCLNTACLRAAKHVYSWDRFGFMQ